jgi:DNA mismatch endonuclease (patch repair protein)
MAAIRATDTEPELAVRREIHALGYRYRLHVRGLPGRPDIVFPSRRKIIFVHGCFWHQHRCRRWSPRTLAHDYWGPKLKGNRKRDRINRAKLRRLGWELLVLWECQIHDQTSLCQTLRSFLR